MKKILLTFLCLTISLTFMSCGKESAEKTKEIPVTESLTESVTESNNFFSLMPSSAESNSKKDTELKYKGKKVKDVKFITSIAINISFDAEFLKDLENIENNESVSGDSLKLLFGTLKIIYDDGTDETVGQVYLGSDSALYLKFSNSENKDAAYKISDSIY